MLNLKHLYYFHIFAQDLSVTKAAKRLLISAPALSNQLKQLEGFLGVSLTRRIGNQVVITEPGEIVLQYTDQMFSAYEALQSKISPSNRNRKANFRVGVTQNLGARFAIDMISLVAKAHVTESASVHISFESSDSLAAGINRGKYDLVIGAIALSKERIDEWIAQKLSFPVRVFAPAETLEKNTSPNALKDKSSLEQVIEFANRRNLSLVVPERGSTLRSETEAALAKSSVRPSRTVECNSSAGIVQLIERGFAYGLVPTPSLLDFKCAASLTVLGPAEGFWCHEIVALIPANDELTLGEIPELADFFSPTANFI